MIKRLFNRNDNIAILIAGIFSIIIGLGVARFAFRVRPVAQLSLSHIPTRRWAGTVGLTPVAGPFGHSWCNFLQTTLLLVDCRINDSGIAWWLTRGRSWGLFALVYRACIGATWQMLAIFGNQFINCGWNYAHDRQVDGDSEYRPAERARAQKCSHCSAARTHCRVTTNPLQCRRALFCG